MEMAEAESEALAASGGVLACSPHMYRVMMKLAEQENEVTVSVPVDVVQQVKDDERH